MKSEFKTVVDDLFDKIDAELDNTDKSAFKIGAWLNEAKVRLNSNKKQLHDLRELRFGDRLTQRMANHYMHLPGAFPDGPFKKTCLTGMIHLAAPCNRDFLKPALAKLQKKDYYPVKEVAAAIEAAKNEAGCEVTPTSPRKSRSAKPKFESLPVKLREIYKKVDTLSSENAKLVILRASYRCDVDIRLSFVSDYDDMGRSIDRSPDVSFDEAELPPSYAIVPVENSAEYERIHNGEILSMDNIQSEEIARIWVRRIEKKHDVGVASAWLLPEYQLDDLIEQDESANDPSLLDDAS